MAINPFAPRDREERAGMRRYGRIVRDCQNPLRRRHLSPGRIVQRTGLLRACAIAPEETFDPIAGAGTISQISYEINAALYNYNS